MSNTPPTRWRSGKTSFAGFGLAAVLLLILGVISYRTIRELTDANTLIARSHRVLEHLFELNLDLDGVETSARNYAITGDKGYLKSFNSGVKSFRETLDELQELTSSNPDQGERLERLKPLIEHQLTLAQKTIRLRRSAGNQAPFRIMEAGYGDEVVPEIRAGIKAMEVFQNELLTDLESQALQSANHTIAALSAGCILVLLFLSAAALINHRDISQLRKIDRDLWQSRQSLQDFLDFANDMIYSTSPEGKFLYVNRKWKETLGYSDEDLEGMSSLDIIHPDHKVQAQNIHQQLTTGATINMFDTVFLTRDGRSVIVSGNMNSRLENGKVVATRSIFRDVSEKRQAQEALERSNKVLLRSVRELEQRTDEISRLSEMVDLLQSCQSAEEAYAVIGRSVPKILPGLPGALGVVSSSRNLLEIVSTWGSIGSIERVFTPEDCWALRRGRPHVFDASHSAPLCPHLGSLKPEEYICLPLIAHGDAIGFLHIQWNAPQLPAGLTSDARQRLASAMGESIALALANLRLREVLSQQSIRDPLTGLFNRRYMEESLERELRRAARGRRPLGVLMLDLDKFKSFNDRFGHNAGDSLLREFGNVLRMNIRGGDISCRYGGEEFAVILPEATLEGTLIRAEQLRDNTKHLSVQHRGQSVGTVTVSIGVAAYPIHGTTSEELLQAADRALYRAKADGRDQVVVAEEAEMRTAE